MEDGEIPSDPVSSTTDKVCNTVASVLQFDRKGANWSCFYVFIYDHSHYREDKTEKR